MLTRRTFAATAALLALSGWVAAPSFAQPADAGARDFIERLGNEAISTFARTDLSRQQALSSFTRLLHEGFDVPYIGRWVLGRHWNAATPQQQQEYLNLFERLIVDTYANRFLEYSGETFRIAGSRPEGERDTMVQTQIVRPAGPPVQVEWRVRQQAPGTFKIIDVVVEGVSMGVTQRSEFASVVQSRGGITGLIDALRSRVSQG
ncbi:MlaC/ttg2D family ABC transporter substrate-binding protein [Azospirillum halopraeferens]|uniref:MlaC/ttg2D family ABC transporter substrate-binding protein n=1 Tax=Azospirillum halopraeferens TaxID=34010 RepID=UPI000412DA6F|nr:ABC transporter substrate-binding protein [Azospirillum halopraeferens]